MMTPVVRTLAARVLSLFYVHCSRKTCHLVWQAGTVRSGSVAPQVSVELSDGTALTAEQLLVRDAAPLSARKLQ